MNGSEVFFDHVHLMYHKCHKRSPNYTGSYVGSPDWIKNKKATMFSVRCNSHVKL